MEGHIVLAWILAACTSAGAVAEPVRTVPLTAVLARVDGEVTVQEKPLARRPHTLPVIRSAQIFQVVSGGDEIRVPAGAGAVLVCSTDRAVMLTAGERRLDEGLCRTGIPLTAGAYQALAPWGGRLRSLDGALLLERRTRSPETAGDEEKASPVLLYPRNTMVLDGRPEIAWTQVEDAASYQVRMSGDVSFSISLPAEQIRCGTATDAGRSVCSMPYPASQPELAPGDSVLLEVSASRSGSLLPGEQGPFWIQRLPARQAADLSSRTKALAALPMDETARMLLQADLDVENRFYAGAIDLYRQVLRQRDLPEIRVTLGNAYLVVGLISRAASIFGDVLGTNLGGAVRAAATVGLGWVEMARGRFDEAHEHFETARKLYADLGLKEEVMTSRQAAEKAQAEARRRAKLSSE